MQHFEKRHSQFSFFKLRNYSPFLHISASHAAVRGQNNLPPRESILVRIRKVVGSIPIRFTIILVKITANLAVIFRLTIILPQTNFCFDHLKDTPLWWIR